MMAAIECVIQPPQRADAATAAPAVCAVAPHLLFLLYLLLHNLLLVLLLCCTLEHKEDLLLLRTTLSRLLLTINQVITGQEAGRTHGKTHIYRGNEKGGG